MELTSNLANRVTPCNGNGNVVRCRDNNAKGTEAASGYVFGQLTAGKPVMIGVDYKEGSGRSNVDDIDPYLVVTR